MTRTTATAPSPAIETHLFADDGTIPNNANLPLIVYRKAFALAGGQPEETIRGRFLGHGWGRSWVSQIFTYHHYHSTAHEVLGIARGWARVTFGGPRGLTARVEAGDAVLIPAGVGHCRVESDGLSVVGAYPKGQDWDLLRATAEDRAVALKNIPTVPLPETDPVFGARGPVHDHWRN